MQNEAVSALEQAIKLVRHPQEYGAISSEYLPYASILPVFAALQTIVRRLPPSMQMQAQQKIRLWYWASVFTNRYSGSVESTSARDFFDVKAWFEEDQAEPSLIAEFRDRVRNIDLRRETRRGTSIYNGVFILLVIRGARDWVTGNIPQYGDLHDHHIVPKKWGQEQGIGGMIDSILNRTPLSADTNRRLIGDRLPNEYLPSLVADAGEEKVRAILESHFISARAFDILLHNPFTKQDFDAFLAERERTIQNAIEGLLEKQRLEIPADLRELDDEVESVELALRMLINDTLGGDPLKLPPHVLASIEERISKIIDKNPALDRNRYSTLSGKLEFADLRELEAIITNRTLWPLFEHRFRNKAVLNARFEQLAGLRNAIRHSRTVDELTRKDGQAALLWFQHVLNE
jgi:hypothetical protein